MSVLALIGASLACEHQPTSRTATLGSTQQLPLPDLMAQVPRALELVKVARKQRSYWELAFGAGVANLGGAPLVLRGLRTSRSVTVRAYQILSDGERVPVGTLFFDGRKTHAHWHLADFERYGLVRLEDHRLIQTIRKIGFCLVDSYALTRPARRSLFSEQRTMDCSRNDPYAHTVTEGLSVGWVDYYAPQVEGQYVDISDVPTGAYLLTEQINPLRTVREASYSNDASAVAFTLRWTRGTPRHPTVVLWGECVAGACHQISPLVLKTPR